MGATGEKRKWYSQRRIALGLGIGGALIVSFEIVVHAEYGAWMLWIAVPMLLTSLLYFLILYALPIYFGSSTDEPSTSERKEEPP
jgi:hypothetical protein